MPSAHIVRECDIRRTARVMQIEGIFDIPPSQRSAESWDVSLDLPTDWNVGLIVGPSGSGKTTVARELFGNAIVESHEWPHDQSVLDGFPPDMGIKDISALLSSVGLSNPPLWLRPYHVLSNGERFRVDIARTLAEQPDLAVIDEFTSVVDRTVAQIGSAAVQKTVRRRGQKLIAVSCHYDIIDWLEPDWVYEPHINDLRVGRSLWRRPPLELKVQRAHHSAWQLFRKYHYLSHTFNKSARLFVAFLGDRPIAMQAVLAQPGRVKNMMRGHRAVCLPDYQGVGIGNALITYVARAYRGIGKRILSTTASPALIHQRQNNSEWKLIGKPHIPSPLGRTSTKKSWTFSGRLMTTWEFVGEALPESEAWALIYE